MTAGDVLAEETIQSTGATLAGRRHEIATSRFDSTRDTRSPTLRTRPITHTIGQSRMWRRLTGLRIGHNNDVHLARFELWPAAAHRLGFAQRQGRVAQTRDTSSRPRTG
jgi:hypothetical protein